MPTNNFKLFDENKANLLTDTEYANATQRLNGVQTGVASSQLNNKFAYQVSLVAYSIAQLMNANGLDASDTLAVSAFVGNLQGALLQKVADKATTAEAAAGVLSNKYITPETMKAAALLLSGGVMSGMLDMGNNRITNLGTPTADSDAVTKAYVDGNKIQKYQVITIPATASNETQNFNFNGISDFKYVQFYFYGTGTSSSSLNYIHLYVGGTYNQIINLNSYRGNAVFNIYGFTSNLNVLFNGFGGTTNNNYYNVLSLESISKSTILDSGIDCNYTMQNNNLSYLICIVI